MDKTPLFPSALLLHNTRRIGCTRLLCFARLDTIFALAVVQVSLFKGSDFTDIGAVEVARESEVLAERIVSRTNKRDWGRSITVVVVVDDILSALDALDFGQILMLLPM